MSDTTLGHAIHRPSLDAKPHGAAIAVFVALLALGLGFAVRGISADITAANAPPLATGAFLLLGLAAIESMASGTPVICSRLGGLAEVVRHGETGFLVQPGDIGELRDRIAMVLADRRLAWRLGDNARLLALEQFTWQACAQRCLAAYPLSAPR